ncbi:hypothetical protein [Seonamhaeicola sp. ML3]|uniref:hypothetical protein n=1 Tax=Seonamhaeicola sp. ML3 TaxID=2937786 RepID=UPI00200F1026|nr:hypothetical protein [Seonamhaeicola sp. ML3]
MKKLILKVVLPLTIISFFVFTKFWYAEVVDAPNTVLYGFPLAFISEGWHTSMSLQIFVLEFLVDFSLYFIFWLLVILGINRFITIKPSKTLALVLIPISVMFSIIVILIAVAPEHMYILKRDFDIEVKSSGFSFMYSSPLRISFD